MRIGLIGGVQRMEPHYERLAKAAGHEVVFHDGHLRGGGGGALTEFIDRCDVVVVLTDVNSHAAVQVARRHLRDHGRTPLLVRKFGLSRFGALLAAVDAKTALERAS